MQVPESSLFGRMHHVGVVVKDMDSAIAHLESIGMGPFEWSDEAKWGVVRFKGELHGNPEEWSLKISNAAMGDVQLELLEPCGGKSALQESLDASGEGLHHVGYLVDDLDASIAAGLSRGLKVWTASRRTDGPGFVYFEPTDIAGIAVELRTR